MKNIIQHSQPQSRNYWLSLAGFVLVLVMVVAVVSSFPRQTTRAASNSWSSYLGGNARTGYASTETTINATTASSLKLLWTAQASGHISSEPLLVNGVVYWGDWTGKMYATNAATGQNLWTTMLSAVPDTCSPETLGEIGTATIATESINGTSTQVVYVGAGKNTVYALNASTGQIVWQTSLGNTKGEFLYGSTAVYNGSVYIGVGSSGDCPLVQGQVVQLNASTGAIEHTFNTVPSGCIGATVWDTPTIDQITGMLYFGSGNADPLNCQTTEPLGSALVELRASDLSLVGSWHPSADTASLDEDFGSTPTLFQATIGGTTHAMVGLEGKDGNYYAFDRSNISAGPLWHVQISVGGRSPEYGKGSISSSAYDGTKLYVAGGNTTINGQSCQGGLRALDPNTGNFQWQVCLNAPALDSVTAAPGVVTVGWGKMVGVFDATSGKTLFSYQDTTSNGKFFGSATIANGVLYAGSRSGHLFAFGAGTPSTPPPGSSPTVSPSPSSTATPPPNPTSGPVNSTWYFAEGKVGAGFTEYITVQNPDPVNACQVSIQYLLSSGVPVTKAIKVNPATRYTESVNSDLHTPASSPNSQVISAIVTVNSTTSPNCKGVVAERPMYFTNFMNVSSGSDVIGATHTGRTFYFADMPTVPGYSSFITILNPPGGSAATVTASYYHGGQQIATQSTTVQPGTRGTIVPLSFSFHVNAVVTSNQPVVVERPSYFSNVTMGNAGVVSGAASVIGAQNPANDWLFAEGYTGSGFQEMLALSNFGTTDTTATVILEYQNGHTQTRQVPVHHQDVTILDVNAMNAHPSGTCDTRPCQVSSAVSAEVTVPTGAAIVAEREMFFHYNNNHGLTAQGGTDVTGLIGPAPKSFSFAEGYTNTGYNEWLTLQNPTTSTETVTITLVNGSGKSYTTQVQVVARSRFTVDITGLVATNLAPAGSTFVSYEVSMSSSTKGTSTALVAERPMYWNTGPGGTQGGSDVFGYK